jgi:hypothetical protein
LVLFFKKEPLPSHGHAAVLFLLVGLPEIAFKNQWFNALIPELPNPAGRGRRLLWGRTGAAPLSASPVFDRLMRRCLIFTVVFGGKIEQFNVWHRLPYGIGQIF